MIQIPTSYYKNDTVHKLVGNNPQYGNISCGFLHKTSRKESNYHTTFEDYGALLLLDGKGVHVNHKGERFELYPGCFIQRRPGKCHHTYIEPDGRWLEFFICFGKDIFKNMVNLGMASGDQDVLYPGLCYGIFENMKELLEKFKTAKEHEVPHLLFECQQMIYQIYVLHKTNRGLQDQMLHDMCSLLKNIVIRVFHLKMFVKNLIWDMKLLESCLKKKWVFHLIVILCKNVLIQQKQFY